MRLSAARTTGEYMVDTYLFISILVFELASLKLVWVSFHECINPNVKMLKQQTV